MSIQRDWLKEAIEIAEGKNPVKPERQHIVALAENYLAVCQKHAYLDSLLKSTLAKIKQNRVEKGLPAMPPRPEEGEEP